MTSPLDLDKDSEYHGFMQAYLTFMPPSHILPLFISGFAFQTLFCNSSDLSLTLFGRVESVRYLNTEMDEVYQQFHLRLLENG
jgi:hypothetical protein